jgi:hypothetical protein
MTKQSRAWEVSHLISLSGMCSGRDGRGHHNDVGTIIKKYLLHEGVANDSSTPLVRL